MHRRGDDHGERNAELVRVADIFVTTWRKDVDLIVEQVG